MVDGAASGIQKLDETVREGGGVADIDVLPALHDVANQILTRTMLSSEVERGRQIYKRQTKLVQILYEALSKPAFSVPCYRYVCQGTGCECRNHCPSDVPTAFHNEIIT